MNELSFAARLEQIHARIDAAARRSGRDPRDVCLLGVSKTKPLPLLQEAWQAGLRDFGENYVQDWRDKAREMTPAAGYQGLRWHFIGHLQRNKLKYLIPNDLNDPNEVRCSLIHSVDRAALLEAIAERSRKVGVVTEILLEVNLGGEASKSGCAEDDLPALATQAAALDGVRPLGLMVIPPFWEPETLRPFFQRLRALRDELRAEIPALGEAFKELSMGMSADFEIAVEEGATIVRVGTDLFGRR
jgi:PLP dependent protein